MMKKNILRILLFACTISFFWSCEKEINLVNSVATTEGMAFIKFVHASPNFRQIYKGRDSFNVYVNNVKINGGFLTYNAVFPTATNLYAAVPAGSQSIRITVNGVLTPDSITLASLNKTLEPGGYYSLILTDEGLSANESRQMWLKDNFALTDTNNFTLRFVNALLNDPVAVDVYSFLKQKNIFTNVTPGTATSFISLEYTRDTDTLYIRPTGTQTDYIKYVNTGIFNRGRAYTIVYRGIPGSTTKPRSVLVYGNN